MSAPATTRAVPRPAPRTRPTGPRRGGTEPSGARRRIEAPSAKREPAGSRRRVRKRGTLAFAVVTAVIATLMILGLAALQALLAQTSFGIDDVQARVAKDTQTNEHLALEAARLQSPQRIAAAAQHIGLVLPSGGVQILHVPDDRPVRPHAKTGAGVRP